MNSFETHLSLTNEFCIIIIMELIITSNENVFGKKLFIYIKNIEIKEESEF
jgi:hypothetical protein